MVIATELQNLLREENQDSYSDPEDYVDDIPDTG